MAVNANNAFLAGHAGVSVIDISVPIEPRPIAAVDPPYPASTVTVVDDYAYIAAGSSGLRLVNVSVPSAPYEVSSYDTSWAQAVTVVNNYAFVADRL